MLFCKTEKSVFEPPFGGYRQMIISFWHNMRIRQMDRETNRWTDRQNCESNNTRCIACSRTVKSNKLQLYN